MDRGRLPSEVDSCTSGLICFAAMAGGAEISKVILDPTLLVEEETLDWLADPELRPFLVVSEAFMQLLFQGADPRGELADFGIPTTDEHFGRLRDLLVGLEQFSSDRDDIPDGARAIRDNLLAQAEPLAGVLADEWVFIVTESIGGFGQKAKKVFDRFRRAGGDVHELSNEKMAQGLDGVRDRLPPKLLAVMKRVGNFRLQGEVGEFLCLGGTIGSFFLPHIVGLPVGIALAVQQGTAVVAGDP